MTRAAEFVAIVVVPFMMDEFKFFFVSDCLFTLPHTTSLPYAHQLSCLNITYSRMAGAVCIRWRRSANWQSRYLKGGLKYLEG